jgi:general secretion pathway protein K
MSCKSIFFGSETATRSLLPRLQNCYNLITNNKISSYYKTTIIPKTNPAGEAKTGPLRPRRSLVRPRQSGIALITAILVVALASIAAAAMLTSANIAIHRTGNLQDTEKAWWYADGVESWVKTILERDANDNKTDSFKDAWAQPVDYLPIDEGHVRGSVEDLQGRFNLNNFGADKVHFQNYTLLFERLFQNIPGVDPSLAKPLADAIRDWIDADSEPTGFDGAEDPEYLTFIPPYRTPNRPMESVSEVLAVKGMTKELYYALTHCAAGKAGPVSCITALPVSTQGFSSTPVSSLGFTTINVNTAPEPLLRALSKQPPSSLVAFLATRNTKPFDSANGPFQPAPVGFLTAADGITADMIDVKSNYFLLHSETFIGSSRVALYSFYYRPASGSAIVLGRSTDIE